MDYITHQVKGHHHDLAADVAVVIEVGLNLLRQNYASKSRIRESLMRSLLPPVAVADTAIKDIPLSLIDALYAEVGIVIETANGKVNRIYIEEDL